MPAHQIWSYHVTQEANFENFLLFPNSAFNIRKVTKFPVEKLSILEVISQKLYGGEGGEIENTPSALRVKLTKQVKLAHSVLQSAVKSVPCYHFKLAYVILQMAGKELSKSTSKNGDIGHFNL